MFILPGMRYSLGLLLAAMAYVALVMLATPVKLGWVYRIGSQWSYSQRAQRFRGSSGVSACGHF
jgi:hypothetical protein